MKGQIAAQLAREAATDENSALFLVCSSQMCWDAAIECQVRAGVTRPQPVTVNSHDHVIALTDSAVTQRLEMQRVPQGASIGFFRAGALIHFMIATGAGFAAGNKNECIGIGRPVGWENLNLANGLNWQQGGFLDAGGRLVLVRYRALT